jgi:hypothetical protein
VVGGALIEQLLISLEPKLTLLSGSLAAALREALRWPRRYRSAADVCRFAQMPRRSCDRSLGNSGLAPLGQILSVARVVQALPNLRRGTSMRETVDLLGFTSERQLAADIRRSTGLSMKELRMLDEAILIPRMLNRLATPST